MPRTSRTVAQRLATQGKSRRRRTTRVGETLPPAVERILDDVAPDVADDPPAEPARRPAAGRAAGQPASARAAAARRPYADYAAEYGYVWADLRRIALVAGGLLLLLIVLSFFIR